MPSELSCSDYYCAVMLSQCRLVIYPTVIKNHYMDDNETKHRRARLRELIEVAFGGKDAALLHHIQARTGKPANQGELSALQKDDGPRSFGDKKAKTLTDQIGLHRNWFMFPMGTGLDRSSWQVEPSAVSNAHAATAPLAELHAAIAGRRIDRDDLVSLITAAVAERDIPEHIRESIKVLITSSPKKTKG